MKDTLSSAGGISLFIYWMMNVSFIIIADVIKNSANHLIP